LQEFIQQWAVRSLETLLEIQSMELREKGQKVKGSLPYGLSNARKRHAGDQVKSLVRYSKV